MLRRVAGARRGSSLRTQQLAPTHEVAAIDVVAGVDERRERTASRGVRRARTARPTCSMRPPRMTTIRSARRKASSTSCVTKSVVVCSSATIRTSSRCSALRTTTSTAPNGSSISSARGRAAIARATPTRCASPPESALGRRVAIRRRVEPDELQQFVDALVRSRRDSTRAATERRRRSARPSCSRTGRRLESRNRCRGAARRASRSATSGRRRERARRERDEPVDGAQRGSTCRSPTVRASTTSSPPPSSKETSSTALRSEPGIAPLRARTESTPAFIFFERRNSAATSAGSAAVFSTAAFIARAARSVIAGETASSTRAICGRAASVAARTTGATLYADQKWRSSRNDRRARRLRSRRRS